MEYLSCGDYSVGCLLRYLFFTAMCLKCGSSTEDQYRVAVYGLCDFLLHL